MKRRIDLRPTWLVGRKTRLRAFEPSDVPLLRRCRLAVDERAWGFVIQTLDGDDIGVLAVLVDGPHAGVSLGFFDTARFTDGCAADALRVIVRGLPRALPVVRIEALVAASRPEAVAAYLRAGFEREGLLREALLEGRARRDAVVMSVLVDG